MTHNYQAVTDGYEDDDGSNNQSATVGQVDQYGHTALATNGAIMGIGTHYVMGKDDSVTRQGSIQVKSGAATKNGTTQTLAIGYIHYVDVFEVDPNTGLPWSVTNWNNATDGPVVIT